MKKLTLSVCQMMVSDKKEDNLKKAEDMIRRAVNDDGANLVVLPEMFNCPYNNSYFPGFAEEYPGPTAGMLSSLAKELGVYIIGGSISEREGDKIYNTSYIFNQEGKLLGSHRKMHLFDIDIEGEITFKESETLGRGNIPTVIETDFCKIGVAICYDMRFPELMRLMVLEGAEIIVIPAAFNMTTGPAHWKDLIKVRAIDNQVYFVAASPARNMKASYQPYGHSAIANPWGDFIAMAGEGEEIITGEIDLDYLEKIRQQLPLLKHRRTDVYHITY
ncbi:carbon-nitrogen hydrolase family protein [Alkaliphilus serpentinus]|uniref:carbon-nitrogen hydrolase family protein n=1 Tax=Alkaliphilus serpentinus TaxID=1482731 RepID=UPI002ED56544